MAAFAYTVDNQQLSRIRSKLEEGASRYENRD